MDSTIESASDGGGLTLSKLPTEMICKIAGYLHITSPQGKDFSAFRLTCRELYEKSLYAVAETYDKKSNHFKMRERDLEYLTYLSEHWFLSSAVRTLKFDVEFMESEFLGDVVCDDVLAFMAAPTEKYYQDTRHWLPVIEARRCAKALKLAEFLREQKTSSRIQDVVSRFKNLEVVKVYDYSTPISHAMYNKRYASGRWLEYFIQRVLDGVRKGGQPLRKFQIRPMVWTSQEYTVEMNHHLHLLSLSPYLEIFTHLTTLDLTLKIEDLHMREAISIQQAMQNFVSTISRNPLIILQLVLDDSDLSAQLMAELAAASFPYLRSVSLQDWKFVERDLCEFIRKLDVLESFELNGVTLLEGTWRSTLTQVNAWKDLSGMWVKHLAEEEEGLSRSIAFGCKTVYEFDPPLLERDALRDSVGHLEFSMFMEDYEEYVLVLLEEGMNRFGLSRISGDDVRKGVANYVSSIFYE